MRYHLKEIPMTIIVAAIGISCALTGGKIIIPEDRYELFPFPPFLALLVVVVSTILLQMYYSLATDQKGVVYLKAYLAKSAGIAVMVCTVGFVSGMLEKAPIMFNGIPVCTGIEICG